MSLTSKKHLLYPFSSWHHYDSKNLNTEKKQQIFKMYQNAYSSIGMGVNDIDVFFTYYYCSYLVLEDIKQSPKAVIMYWIHDYGYKIGVLFSDGTVNGKNSLIDKLASLIEQKGWFVELSGAPHHIMMTKKHKMPINDIKLITKVTGIKQNDINTDGGYVRVINGEPHSKYLYGKPCEMIVKNKICGKKNVCNDHLGGYKTVSNLRRNYKGNTKRNITKNK
jgi:hypothetical protein